MEEIAEALEHLEIASNDDRTDRVPERLGYEGEVKLTSRVPRIDLGR